MSITWSRRARTFGPVTVPDRLQQQVPQRVALERLAEHVEDLALVGRPLLFYLVQERLEDATFPGVGRDQVPQVAHLGLADAVDPAEPLLDPVRVPRQVIVDHEVSALQVQALARGVGGDEHPGLGVLGEQLHDLAPFLAADTAVDGDDRLGTAEQVTDTSGQVLQGVAVLGEHDDLPDVAAGAGDQRVVGEQLAELGPLLVRAAVPHSPGEFFQVGEDQEFLVQLGDRPGGGSRVGDLGLDLLGLLAGRSSSSSVSSGMSRPSIGGAVPRDRCHWRCGRRSASRGGGVPGVCGGVPATEDRLGTGGQPSLQHGEREADGKSSLAVAFLSEPFGAVHLLPDVLGDRLVQVVLVGRELVAYGVGPPLREQRLALEGLQVLLHHAAHQAPRCSPCARRRGTGPRTCRCPAGP